MPGKFHGQRSLVGYSPWGHKEVDMTEQLTLSTFNNVSNNANYSFVIFLSSFFFFWKSLIRYEDSSVTQINVRQVDQKCLDHTKLEKKI